MESNLSENEMPSNNLSDYLVRQEKSAGSNRDTDALGTIAAGPFVVGSVEAINGEDGKEKPELKVILPTPHGVRLGIAVVAFMEAINDEEEDCDCVFGPRAERVFGAADCGNPDPGIL